MFAIMVLEQWPRPFYGPFTTRAAAEDYAINRGLPNNEIIHLNDSGDCMDWDSQDHGKGHLGQGR